MLLNTCMKKYVSVNTFISRSVPECTFPWRDSYRRRNPGRYRGCRDRPARAHSVGWLRLKPVLPPHSASPVCRCCHLMAEIRHRTSRCCLAEGPVWIFSQRSAEGRPGSSQTCALDPHGWRSDGRASRLPAARRERKERRSGSNRLCSWLWSGKFVKEVLSVIFGIGIVILDDVDVSALVRADP